MKKLFILTTCISLTGLAASAQNKSIEVSFLPIPANVIVHSDAEYRKQVEVINDAAREVSATKTAQLFVMEFGLSAEQFQLTKAAIAASDKRWGNNGEPFPLDFDVDAAAKAETKRFHEDLQNIFTYAQYKKYEQSEWYHAD